MSNDLLFPILPRNTRVPVEVDERVKKVEKAKKNKGYSEEEHKENTEIQRTKIAHAEARSQSQNSDDGEEKSGLKHIDVDV
ncbi:hypothetical protein [Alteromonas gracilis]|uniref:hypothetical protein n=1 Tax=Alteromonas gracilis TaxID=1479524 RepID=UPI0037351A18